MGFALEANEQFLSAVKRIAVEQIDFALDHLRNAGEDLNSSVHATRQSLKRIRALLALAREDLGDRIFKQEWASYRAAGRLLAGGRDAVVVVETFDALVRHFSSELSEGAFAVERRLLANRRDSRLRIMVEEDGALKQVCEMLVSARERVADWPVKRTGFEALRQGVRRSYRNGRRGLRKVIRYPTPTNFHAWRKPVKLLWHQLQILTPIWPIIMGAHAEELHELSDRLNANHDLDVLRHACIWSPAESQGHECEALFALIDRRCRELEANAVPLGERLYTERTNRFTDRLEGYWETWRHSNPDGTIVSDSRSKIAGSICT